MTSHSLQVSYCAALALSKADCHYAAQHQALTVFHAAQHQALTVFHAAQHQALTVFHAANTVHVLLQIKFHAF
jgi:ABC-type molybdate transport system substrate-binding protein